jgi:hypothetical protein
MDLVGLISEQPWDLQRTPPEERCGLWRQARQPSGWQPISRRGNTIRDSLYIKPLDDLLANEIHNCFVEGTNMEL